MRADIASLHSTTAVQPRARCEAQLLAGLQSRPTDELTVVHQRLTTGLPPGHADSAGRTTTVHADSQHTTSLG